MGKAQWDKSNKDMKKRIKQKPIDYFGVANITGLAERMDHRHAGVLFTRVWSMPNHETFKIEAIARLLKRYVPAGGIGWVDPFAGRNSPAGMRNDHNPVMPTHYHMEAVEFAKRKVRKCDGVIFDPPYSFRQVSEHYRIIGKKATQKDTSMAFYEKVKSALCEKVKKGGYVISFGWNSSGFGIRRGFEMVEILMVAHGGTKNDTIVVVERKL